MSNLVRYYDLARKEMEKHGLSNWGFAFDSARRRAGCCKFSRKMITLSKHFAEMNPESVVLDTILHEIAHALAGPKAGHGPDWKKVYLEIGANPTRCYDTAVVKMPPKPLQATCGCGKVFRRHRLPGAGRWLYCRKCGKENGRLMFKRI